MEDEILRIIIETREQFSHLELSYNDSELLLFKTFIFELTLYMKFFNET
jgi:hypothetical protein